MSDAKAPAPAAEPSVVEETAAATPANEQPAANEAPPPARARIKVSDAELDDAAYVDLLRETLGDEVLPNIGELARIARAKVSNVGKTEHQLRQAIEDLRDEERAFDVLERIHGTQKARAMMERRYARYLEDDATPPEEREKRGVQSDVERLRAEREALLREKQEREKAAMVAQLTPQFGRDFSRALTAAGSEPDPEQLAAMAAYVEQELDHVGSEADYRALVAEAARATARRFSDGVAQRLPKLPKERAKPALRELLKGWTAEEIADLLGDEGRRKLRAHEIEAVKRATPANGAPARSAPKATNGQRQRMTLDEFFAAKERDRT
jgi:hypothetical protein